MANFSANSPISTSFTGDRIGVIATSPALIRGVLSRDVVGIDCRTDTSSSSSATGTNLVWRGDDLGSIDGEAKQDEAEAASRVAVKTALAACERTSGAMSESKARLPTAPAITTNKDRVARETTPS